MIKKICMLFLIVISGCGKSTNKTVQPIEPTQPDNKIMVNSASSRNHEVKYANGQVKECGKIVDANKVGLWQEWYEDGKPYKEIVYNQEGQPDGTMKDWFPSGSLKSTMEFKNGVAEGLTTYFHENGTKRAEETYINGKLEGTSKVWDKDGKITQEITYKNHKYDGILTYYNKDGSIKLKQLWENGQFKSTVE